VKNTKKNTGQGLSWHMKWTIIGMCGAVGTDSTAVAVAHHVLLKIVKDVSDLLS